LPLNSTLPSAHFTTLTSETVTSTIYSHIYSTLYRAACRWLVLLAEGETALQGMTDGITEIGRFSGMERNMEKTKVIRIS